MQLLIFHSHIQDEIEESYNWYESKLPGLGENFLDELENSYSIIQKNPEMYLKVSGDVRRYLVIKFPFGILYKVTDENINIVAVMHLKRKPDYWQKRI